MSDIQHRIFFERGRLRSLGYVSLAGIQTTAGLPKHPLRVFGQYAIVYITNGRGELRDALGYHGPVGPGDLLFLFPEIGHTYHPYDGQAWDEIFVVFGGELFDLWRQSKLLNPTDPIVHLEPIEFWSRQLIDSVWSVPESGSESALLRICRLQQFIADARRHRSHDAVAGEDSAWLSHAKILLESELNRQPDYSMISLQLGMSYDGFRKRFAKETGLSPGKYHSRHRIDQACLLLATKSLTLKEIAGRLGFSDEFHLSKRFKQTIGMSPREFRKFFVTK